MDEVWSGSRRQIIKLVWNGVKVESSSVVGLHIDRYWQVPSQG